MRCVTLLRRAAPHDVLTGGPSSRAQKKEALSDTKLPEEFRVAIAKSLVDDLFSKVPVRLVSESCGLFFIACMHPPNSHTLGNLTGIP
jgi:hypothetical protein